MGANTDAAAEAVHANGHGRNAMVGAMLGTIFEWYDFFLFALLAIYFAASFFPPGNEVAGLLFALATFGAGFIVRPLGALLFGSIGDRIGRKFSFLVTVSLMGFATAAVGVLPTFETIGWAAPVLLLASRLLQGLSVGGEYGGAVTYIAEQTSPKKRGVSTSWLQTTATGGQLLALGVILGCQTTMSKEAFASWGWRIPFLLSVVLLVVSVYIRFGLKESPTFQLLKEAGKTASSPVRESFGSLHNCRKILIAISICAAQGSIGYTGAVYPLYFLINVLKFDALNANLLMALAIIAGLPILILAGKLSDVWGRKWIMVGACLLSALTFVPIFEALVHFGNPALERFQLETPITVLSDNCVFHLFTSPQTKLSDCDRVKNYLNKAGLSYTSEAANGRDDVLTKIGEHETTGYDPGALKQTLDSVGYPETADTANRNTSLVLLLLIVLIGYGSLIYGPLAAFLVEQFPTRIRNTSVAVSYNFGTGWFGGVTPFIASALALSSGNIFAGLWYPTILVGSVFLIGALFIRETPGRPLTD